MLSHRLKVPLRATRGTSVRVGAELLWELLLVLLLGEEVPLRSYVVAATSLQGRL